MFAQLLQEAKRPVYVVSLEGLIGCGKSTQLELLKSRYANDKRVAFVDEPVEAWNDLGILQAMYDGQLDKGMFQLTALMSRIAPIMTAMHSEAEVIVTERSWISDFFVFAQANLRDPMHMSTYKYTFQQLQDALEHLVHVHMTMLYLRCPVETAMARMRDRARDAESGVAEAYMKTLHDNHERMIAAAANDTLAFECRAEPVPPRPPGMNTVAVGIDSTTTDRTRIHEIIVAEVEGALEKALWGKATSLWMARQAAWTAAEAEPTPLGPHPCEDSRPLARSSC